MANTLTITNDVETVSVDHLSGTLQVTGGKTLTVSGNCVFNADLTGVTSAFALTVTGTNVAHDATITNCNAAGGTELDATDNCVDGGGNTNVDFGTVRSVAHFGVVPYQRFVGAFKIGVVAFAEGGVVSVAFSISDGSTTQTPTVTLMTLNSRTNTWEYWTEIDGADFDDGNITIDATVRAGDSAPRELTQIAIRNNDGGALAQLERWVARTDDTPAGNDANAGTLAAPMATIGKAAADIYANNGSKCDGGVIYLQAGIHSIDNGGNWGTYTCTDEWLTIMPASGLTKADVTLDHKTNTLTVMKVRIHDLTCTTGIGSWWTSGESAWLLWFDDSTLTGTDRSSSTCVPGCKQIAATDSEFSTMYQVAKPDTIETAGLFRHTYVHGLDSDAFRMPSLNVNCQVDDVYGTQAGEHADVFQYGGGYNWANSLVFNLKATNCKYQGVMGNIASGGFAASNIAFINALFEMTTGDSGNTMLWQQHVDHMLMWNCTFIKGIGATNAGMRYYKNTSENITIANSSWRGCKFVLTATQAAPSVAYTNDVFSDCHIDTASDNQWENLLTSGETNGAAGLDANWRPAAGSTLIDRMTRLVPCDLDNNARASTTAVGAYRGPAETP